MLPASRELHFDLVISRASLQRQLVEQQSVRDRKKEVSVGQIENLTDGTVRLNLGMLLYSRPLLSNHLEDFRQQAISFVHVDGSFVRGNQEHCHEVFLRCGPNSLHVAVTICLKSHGL